MIVVAWQIDGVGYRVGTHLVCLVVGEFFAYEEGEVVVVSMVGEYLTECLFQPGCNLLFFDEVQIHVNHGVDLRIELQIILYLIVFAAVAHIFINT